MAELFDDSSVVTQFLPSLLHLAAVREAMLLLKDFDFDILELVYRSIEKGKLITRDNICDDPKFINLHIKILKCRKAIIKCKIELLECKRPFLKSKGALKNRKNALKKRRSSFERKIFENCEANPLIKRYRAQQKLLMIPPRLRQRVMEAVQGLVFGVRRWKADHSGILKLEDGEYIFYCKSDGTIDGTETAQQLVLNSKIDIRQRFHLACTYCFEENIKTLWTEMKDSGSTENFKTSGNSLVHFWVRRMRQGSRIPWNQDFCKYIRLYPRFMILRFSSFFPLLRPQHREKFLLYLQFAKFDDFRICLRSMTKEEEERILELCPYKLLHCYLQWPLRSLFLETAEKTWNYIDDFCFRFLLNRLFFIKEYDEFDTSDLFEEFWSMSPNRLRETAKEYPQMREKIDSCLNEIRRKREAHFDELRNSEQTRYPKQNITMFKKKSDIWTNFKLNGPNKVTCGICKQSISVAEGSTSNLNRHLKRKHVRVPVLRSDHEEEPEMLPSTSAGGLISENLRIHENEETEESENPESETEQVAPENNNSSITVPMHSRKRLKMSNQTSMFNFFERPLTMTKKQEIDNQILRMIVKENHPFSIVEDREFRKLVKMLCPEYVIPSRKTFTNSLLPSLYNTELQKCRNLIQSAKSVSLTTDCWTSINTESFLAVTAHFASEKCSLLSILLGCIQVTDRYTIPNLAAE
ncbi:hypothetical protein AVEN_183817-1 [Araneus ventricosus]|uniref:BED-type domain-containing protein n=1 Tax=Araneus ventricosus TaxID=182803 RepID=A0A4Y2NA22_ARAVE|nr:hypothetical protein AVEN_183817-1 [Araneus ventricosus]